MKPIIDRKGLARNKEPLVSEPTVRHLPVCWHPDFRRLMREHLPSWPARIVFPQKKCQ
jgi:hypothetical protein